jgi:cytochrome c peroxidase
MFTTINFKANNTSQALVKEFGWFLILSIPRLIGFLLVFFLLSNCTKKETEEVKPVDSGKTETPYTISLPDHFSAPLFDLTTAKLSKEKFALGKELFYDGILSLDGRINCGTCHISFGAFANPDHPTSHGIRDQFGKRNAPPLQNLMWKREYMWDGGIGDLGLVAMSAIENPLEMDDKMPNVLRKVNAKPDYKSKFEKVYGSSEVTGLNLLDAIAHFMIELISAESRYDYYVTGKPGADFTQDEIEGLAIFRQKCASCHKEPFFTDNSFRNNGLDTSIGNDLGRYGITLRNVDKYKFRVPSLRNVTQTGPYMHNGQMRTLETVLKHYAQNAKRSANTDTSLIMPNGKVGIPLDAEEQRKIIAFLGTLRDVNFIRNTRFAEE